MAKVVSSMEFSSYCEENGIIHQTSALYTPQEKGLAERKNKTLVDMLNFMLVNAKLLTSLVGGELYSLLVIYIIEFLLYN